MQDGTIIGIAGVARDMTERKKGEFLRIGQNHILEMVASNASLQDVLLELARFSEAQMHGIKVSILLLDPNSQTLHHGAAPSLPPSYWRSIEGVRIGPETGSCGTAAYHRRQVIVRDMMSDPLWRDSRDLAIAHGSAKLLVDADPFAWRRSAWNFRHVFGRGARARCQ